MLGIQFFNFLKQGAEQNALVPRSIFFGYWILVQLNRGGFEETKWPKNVYRFAWFINNQKNNLISPEKNGITGFFKLLNYINTCHFSRGRHNTSDSHSIL